MKLYEWIGGFVIHMSKTESYSFIKTQDFWAMAEMYFFHAK